MVTAFTHSGAKGSGWLGKLTLVLGAIFLASTSYIVLKGVVSGGASGAFSPGAPPVTLDALQRLTPGERADEEAEAREAFAIDPLDATAVLDLSIFVEAGGNSEASERLRLSAGDMMPRDTRIQAEVLAILLRRGDFAQVMNRLDGLIRARPAEAANFFALAAGITANPDGSRAVARTLATNPPWRQQFFAYIIAQRKPEIASRIFDDMRAQGRPADDRELASVINAYLSSGNIDQAYAVWLSNLSEDELKDVKRVYDGGFDHPLRNLFFDWTVKPADGLTSRVFPRNTASMDQTLQLDFADFRGTFSNLSQILRLHPGRYRLSGEVRTEGFESPTGLVFRIYCMDGQKRQLSVETAPLPQSRQWIDFDKTFQIPNGNCDNQVLRLESQHALDKSQITRGLVAIDVIAVDSAPALAP